MEDDPNCGPDSGVVLGDVVTVDEQVTGRGFDEGGKEFYQGRLAGAVRPYENYLLSRPLW